jgi:hypothetical protein
MASFLSSQWVCLEKQKKDLLNLESLQKLINYDLLVALALEHLNSIKIRLLG